MNEEEKRAKLQQCLENARHLLESAKEICLHKDRQHIAYHLCTAALEELGKYFIVITQSASLGEKTEWLSDHPKKLFWALWSSALSKGSASATEINRLKALANTIHSTRLETLYVDVLSDQVERMQPDEVEALIKVTESRLRSEEVREPAEPSDQERADLAWFMTAAEDKRFQGFIFGPEAMGQLEVLHGRVQEWVPWLKTRIDELERYNRELLEKELNALDPELTKANILKWRMRLRIYASSHTIRGKELSAWNKNVRSIKLLRGKDKHEMRVELTWPKSVALKDLWQISWSATMRFVVALNIGSMGMFWWYAPQFVTKFYDEVFDLENRAPFTMEQNPPATPQWGKPESLNAHDLTNAGAVWTYLALGNEQRADVYSHYLRGLSLLVKGDIFFPFEANCIEEFYAALRNALKHDGLWDGRSNFYDAALPTFQALLTETNHFCHIIETAEKVVQGVACPITSTDAAGMKMYFDMYTIKQARAYLKEKYNAVET